MRVRTNLRTAATSALLVAGLAAGLLSTAPATHAASGFSYRSDYSVQAGWLCYGWPNGTLHCTSHWTTSNGHYVSLNPSWVPSQASGGSAPASAPKPAPAPSSGGGISPTPRNLSQWANPGLGTFVQPSGKAPYPWGQCTYVAAWLGGAAKLANLHNAGQWDNNARARGLAVGGSARVGSTAVFEAGVQGAGSLGHVAHVIRVYANGWFLVEEGNFGWNGGGFGRVSYRYAHTGAGVSFIY